MQIVLDTKAVCVYIIYVLISSTIIECLDGKLCNYLPNSTHFIGKKYNTVVFDAVLIREICILFQSFTLKDKMEIVTTELDILYIYT